jgi:hypothetical protein
MQLLIMLEVPLQIHVTSVFVLPAHFQISSSASELSFVALTTFPPLFFFLFLPFDKVAQAFM